MDQCDPMRRLVSREGRLELEHLLQRFMLELLVDGFSPGTKGAPAEPAAEPAHPSEAYAVDLVRIAVEHANAGVREDFDDLQLLPRLEVVISEDSYHRDLEAGRQVLGQDSRLLGQSV